MANKQNAKAGFAGAIGSAATLKAEVRVLNVKVSRAPFFFHPTNDTLSKVLDLMEQLCAVTENLESQKPPNARGERRG